MSTFDSASYEDMLLRVDRLESENAELKARLAANARHIMAYSSVKDSDRTPKIFERLPPKADVGIVETVQSDVDTDTEIDRVWDSGALQYAINNVDESIYCCGLDGSVIFWNKAFSRRVCCSPKGMKIYDLKMYYSNQESWARFVESIPKDGSPHKESYSLMQDDGSGSHFEFICYYISSMSQEPQIWFFSRNVTERATNEQEIRDLNYLMEVILNNIPVYVFVKDPNDDFRYLYWNKAFEYYSKIPASAVLGNTDFDFFPNPDDAEKFRRDDLLLMEQGSMEPFDEEYQDASGMTRVVHTLKTLAPPDNKNPFLIGISWDITDIKKTQAELIEARLKAEQSDRLKSTFLANMSHEIRTPLNAIVGFSNLLSIADDDDDDKAQYADIIETNAELLLRLIDDILDLSKIEAGTLEFINRDVSLRSLCLDIHGSYRSRMHDGVDLILEDSPAHVIVSCDPNRIMQVVTNLLNNAIKFTEVGSIRFGYSLQGDTILFHVTDTGKGMTQKDTSRIFERFVKLNSFVQGTGLGLSICHMIVGKIGGEIWAESQEGVGTSMFFTIPLSLMVVDANDAASNSQSICRDEVLSAVSKSDDRKSILIAEDIESNFILLKSILGKSYTLIRAYNGQQAVELYESSRPDLILMDMKMPVMDGLDATRAIRKLSTDIPIIAVTAFAFESNTAEALAAGCNSVITKPVSVKELNETIATYLE